MLQRQLLSIIIVIAAAFYPAARAQTGLIGDEVSGSRSNSVHIIPLYDDANDQILSTDNPAMPFSTRHTCGKCHDYSAIAKGWHFNPFSTDHGRSGQPWIYADQLTGTVIPLSYRSWPGTLKPHDLGLSPWKFSSTFGPMTPGGGPGELQASEPNEIIRTFVSGKFEINCFACHNLSPQHDHAEHALQAAKQNFRWTSAASSGIATVNGSAKDMPNTFDPQMPRLLDSPDLIAPQAEYKSQFDSKHRVFMNVSGKIPNERCFSCHSTKDIDRQARTKAAVDEDVHMAAGMKCVDCHREDLGHNTIRGYPGEKSANVMAAATTCESCHMDESDAAGRFAAPKAKHQGLPIVHLEKLTCTACHSGPMAGKDMSRVKTSLAHRIGTHNANLEDESLPHILRPVYARDTQGKIAPHNVLWPAYWGYKQADQILPLTPEAVAAVAGGLLSDPNFGFANGWPVLNDARISQILISLQQQYAQPVYVAGGKIRQLANGKVMTADHKSADPYIWQFGHDVRPARQALGAKGCDDCHSIDSKFLFADVKIDSPIEGDSASAFKMAKFQQLDPLYHKAFAFSFVFRPWLKVVALSSTGLITAILLVNFLSGLSAVLRTFGEKK